jgi:plasmid replication initiation protein
MTPFQTEHYSQPCHLAASFPFPTYAKNRKIPLPNCPIHWRILYKNSNSNNHVNRCFNFWRQKCDHVTKKETEKILKYKDLTTEIQHMWNKQVKVIPVVTGASGTISKSLRQYLSNILGKHKIKGLQKTSILDTAHILQKVLMYMYKTYFKGKITL